MFETSTATIPDLPFVRSVTTVIVAVRAEAETHSTLVLTIYQGRPYLVASRKVRFISFSNLSGGQKLRFLSFTNLSGSPKINNFNFDYEKKSHGVPPIKLIALIYCYENRSFQATSLVS